MVPTPRSPLALARGRVGKARRARGASRELVVVVAGRRFRVPCAARLTELAGSPPGNGLGLDLASVDRSPHGPSLAPLSGLQSRRPGGATRRGRGEKSTRYATSAPRAWSSSRSTERWQRASSAQ